MDKPSNAERLCIGGFLCGASGGLLAGVCAILNVDPFYGVFVLPISLAIGYFGWRRAGSIINWLDAT